MSQLLKASGAVVKRIGKAAKTSLAVVGFGTVASLGYYYNDTKKFAKEEGSLSSKQRVLVLPFHRFKIVKKEDRDKLAALLQSTRRSSSDDEEVDVQELVQVIHEATNDPSVVAIYGEFGHGGSFTGGAADAEQVRNALRIFRESHRVHADPNCNHETVLTKSLTPKRPLYAYADTFESMINPSNPDYYLASIFTHVHLQQQGSLNFAGFSSSVPFLKDTLKKYGVAAHVYKHGPYKNAPNSLTESGLTRAHRQNIETYLFAMNQGRCHDIAAARRKTLQAMTMKGADLQNDLTMMWKLVQNGGSFTAQNALQMGFVDYITDRSPLDALLEYNKKEEKDGKKDKTDKKKPTEAKKESQKDDDIQSTDKNDKQPTKEQLRLKETWGRQTDLESFSANETVTFSEYQKLLAKRKKLEQQKERLWKAADRYPTLGKALTAMGYTKDETTQKEDSPSSSDDKDKTASSEKIALVSVNGAIDSKKYRKLAPMLRKIKYDKDIKAVVVQVDSPGGTIDASEALYQDFKDLPQNVIFSFGNVAASGGYYIATAGDRIFASKNTLTGSIGVFAIRLDLSGLAAQYGAKFGHVYTSELALTNNAFYPVTKQMHLNAERYTDRCYQRFKDIVSAGRSLDEDYLETKLAQGRVWTGEQANQNGLVDELGGLSRAIAYAQRTYTTDGNARVVTVTDDDYMKRINKLLSSSASVWASETTSSASNGMNFPAPVFPGQFLPSMIPNKAFGVYLTTDENTAIQHLMQDKE
ncbi:Putative signal peptide peptidase SppA [Seminavis robusta]|uniref:Signal peptide peptidase SppA n=1 Tax=Seminavis robusta TaxID=568900 RepID=A0A9N8EJR9_9STRA|nr:Putative signal peptide peptidase SppA [Seminavis robusta]|eukprot:Sro1259_g256940.1 Putative signal peptide peptidase SppA (755) ;mRNA; f:23954-26600